jgi:hypothetical protein
MSLGTDELAPVTMSFTIFRNLLHDSTVLATLCWRSRINWQWGGRHGNPILFEVRRVFHVRNVYCFSIRVPRARNSHQLIHYNSLRLPSKSRRLKRERKPGIKHLASPVVQRTRLAQLLGRQAVPDRQVKCGFWQLADERCRRKPTELVSGENHSHETIDH